MVDLREAFQPFVDEPSVGPRPMVEIAARARRRRLRRWSTATGIAAGVVALVIAVGRPDPDDGVATVNGPAPTTSAPATTTTTTTTTAPTPPTQPPPTEGLVATAGITASESTTSSWDGGSCVEVRLENTTDAPVTWEVTTTPAGAITSMWNAVTPDQATFTGDQWNATLAPGLTTTFGYCVEG